MLRQWGTGRRPLQTHLRAAGRCPAGTGRPAGSRRTRPGARSCRAAHRSASRRWASGCRPAPAGAACLRGRQAMSALWLASPCKVGRFIRGLWGPWPNYSPKLGCLVYALRLADDADPPKLGHLACKTHKICQLLALADNAGLTACMAASGGWRLAGSYSRGLQEAAESICLRQMMTWPSRYLLGHH